jgi:hypothetical protein
MLCAVEPPGSPITLTIPNLRDSLKDIVEPDFGLLDHLLSLGVLTSNELREIESYTTTYRRNARLLEYLVTKSTEQCFHFIAALKSTNQTHVVNYILQNGGQFSAVYDVKHFRETYKQTSPDDNVPSSQFSSTTE